MAVTYVVSASYTAVLATIETEDFGAALTLIKNVVKTVVQDNRSPSNVGVKGIQAMIGAYNYDQADPRI